MMILSYAVIVKNLRFIHKISTKKSNHLLFLMSKY